MARSPLPRWCRSFSRCPPSYCSNASSACVPMSGCRSEGNRHDKMEILAAHLPERRERHGSRNDRRAGDPAQTAVLKTTAWGGKWGEVMKGQIIPVFEKEFKCKVETDSAFPYYPKLQATPKNAPLYDVLHTNTS